MLDTYTLMKLEEPLGIFTRDTETDTFSLQVFPDKHDSLPFWLKAQDKITDEILKEWIADRVCPPNRLNIDTILSDLGLSEYNPWEMSRRYRGLCPTDPFWLAKEGQKYISVWNFEPEDRND